MFNNIDEAIIGKEFNDEIINLIKKNKLTYRIVEEDGNCYIITDDFKIDRLNITLEKGITTQIHRG